MRMGIFGKSYRVEVDGRSRKFKVIAQIGEGGFGYVYKVKDVKSKDFFAIKRLICQEQEQELEVQREVGALKATAGHDHTLELLGWAQVPRRKNGGTEHLLLAPLYHADLQREIDRGPGWPWPTAPPAAVAAAAAAAPGGGESGAAVSAAVRAVLGACRGVAALHAAGFKHNDIKPANILVSADWGRVVVVDFGSVEPLEVRVTSRQQALMAQENAQRHTTAAYRAPELFDCPSPCVLGGAADAWSLGCVLFALLTSRGPFESPTEGVQTLRLLAGRVAFPDEEEEPPPPPPGEGEEGGGAAAAAAARALVRGLLERDPARRHTVAQAIEVCEEILSPHGPKSRPPSGVGEQQPLNFADFSSAFQPQSLSLEEEATPSVHGNGTQEGHQRSTNISSTATKNEGRALESMSELNYGDDDDDSTKEGQNNPVTLNGVVLTNQNLEALSEDGDALLLLDKESQGRRFGLPTFMRRGKRRGCWEKVILQVNQQELVASSSGGGGGGRNRRRVRFGEIAGLRVVTADEVAAEGAPAGAGDRDRRRRGGLTSHHPYEIRLRYWERGPGGVLLADGGGGGSSGGVPPAGLAGGSVVFRVRTRADHDKWVDLFVGLIAAGVGAGGS